MNLTYETFAANACRLQERLARLCRECGRHPAAVKLLAVTKTHPAAAAELAARYGLPAVGENRVQEAAAKKPLGPPGLRWELIGHLQSNKAKLAVQTFDRIQTLDSVKLAGLLERFCAEQNKIMPVLLEVNAGDDPAKSGVTCQDAPALLEAVLRAEHLRVEGLMAVAPLSGDPTVAAACFSHLRELRDQLADQFKITLPELSMGMTDDLEEAIKAGSTMVRVGTALFGPREPARLEGNI